MAKTIKLVADDGSNIEFIDEVIGSGAMKDVYFSPDKSYVVGFFRKPQDAQSVDRLRSITNRYRDSIFNQPGGDYWKDLFCWPITTVKWENKIGIVCPAYQQQFIFPKGSRFEGKEKEGKWFASAKLRNRFLNAVDKGTWLTHYHMCIQIARAVKRLHAAGLAHSDLSYKNVLVDPVTGKACVIDIDGLVIPGKYLPDVAGTQDFIAPEVLATKHLKIGDPNKGLPNIRTDRHALAVLIYMYLLNRHPLRGGKVHDSDANKDEELAMGSRALFIEHPTDKSNRPNMKEIDKWEMPQSDIKKRPYSICGPYLQPLFQRAFIEGLHNPDKRPTADEWEQALIKTTDLMQPCQNPDCEAKWFVFDNTTKPKCPFCGTPFKGQLPVLNFYYAPRAGKFIDEKLRLMVYHQQCLYKWHINRRIVANERTNPEDKKPVGDFHFHHGRWILINRSLKNMKDVTEATHKPIPVGGYVELRDGAKILMDTEDGGRLFVVQLVKN
ncbi:MAG: kinase [Akkermansiaceae bacterium]|nr:kinase [Akkermansiaceae bacterium]